MKNFNNNGLTMVEVVMTLAVLSIVICPLMNILILSQKINNISDKEYKSIQTAQYYMEKIKSSDEIDLNSYTYNAENNCFEKNISEENHSAEIKVRRRSYGLYYVEVSILRDEKLVNSLTGSVIYD